MANRVSLQVHIAFDEEAGVWYITKSDIPGLSLEASTPQLLLERVVQCAPELIELNQGLLTQVVDAELDAGEIAANRAMASERGNRPRMAVLPVFDTPLDLAFA